MIRGDVVKKIWGVAVVVVLGVSAFAVYSINKNKSQSRQKIVRQGEITEAIYGLGTVEPKQKFSFKVGVPKNVRKVFVAEGDVVRKGQNLLSFDDGISVTSLIDGTVTNLPYKIGENVFTDQPVVTVENLRDLYLEARLDQQGALRVKKGMVAKISFENLRQQVFEGKIDSLYPSQGLFVARILVDALPEEILPGMTADVAIQVATKKDVLLVPIMALNNGQVVRAGTGGDEKINVKVGIMDNEYAEVLSEGLKAGDRVYLKEK